MGMPNIPTKILSEININRDELMEIFCKAINTNKDCARKLFNNERDIMRLLKQSYKGFDEKQIKKIINSSKEIKEILFKKNEVTNDMIKHVEKLCRGSLTENKSQLYILFFLLVIGLSGFKKNHYSDCYYN